MRNLSEKIIDWLMRLSWFGGVIVTIFTGFFTWIFTKSGLDAYNIYGKIVISTIIALCVFFFLMTLVNIGRGLYKSITNRQGESVQTIDELKLELELEKRKHIETIQANQKLTQSLNEPAVFKVSYPFIMKDEWATFLKVYYSGDADKEKAWRVMNKENTENIFITPTLTKFNFNPVSVKTYPDEVIDALGTLYEYSVKDNLAIPAGVSHYIISHFPIFIEGARLKEFSFDGEGEKPEVIERRGDYYGSLLEVRKPKIGTYTFRFTNGTGKSKDNRILSTGLVRQETE